MKHRRPIHNLSTCIYSRTDATVEATDLHLISENEVKLFQTKPSNKGPLWRRWTHYGKEGGKKTQQIPQIKVEENDIS